MGCNVIAGENMDEILNEDAEQSTAQQYEGDDIGALATAKQRMAERDAEYSAAFAKATADKPEEKPAKRAAKPRTKPVAKEAKATKEVPPFAEDAPTTTKRKSEMTAPIVKAVEQSARKVAADNADAGDTKFADVKGGLRGLKGGTEIPADDPKKDRAEYLAAWKDD